MKSTGITRRLDELGRIVIPIDLRRRLEFNEREKLEIYIEGNKIILQVYNNRCSFCSSSQDLELFKDKYICQRCKSDIQNQ